MLAATIIATALSKPLSTPSAFAAGVVHGLSDRPCTAGTRVLLVDDTVNRGRAMRDALAKLGNRASKVTRMAVYGSDNEPSEEHCDIWLGECSSPRVFAWNIGKHIRNRAAAWDMDGAICADWQGSEKADAGAYAEHLKNAPPLLLPSIKIKAVVTWRLEKYRGETVEWLSRHGVQYDTLVMATTDMREMMHPGTWKADISGALDLEMFIESDPKQARRISEQARIPVYCVSSQKWVRPQC